MQHHLVTPRRQGVPVAVPLVAIVAASWAMLVALTLTADGGIVRHDRLLQGGPPLWIAALAFLGGWQVMLWAMMVPPALDAIEQRRSLRRTSLFLAGYLGLWTLFGLCAFFFDAGIHTAVRHSPWLQLHPWAIAGTLLVIVGTYQLSKLKAASLAACRLFVRSPAGVDTSHRTGDFAGGVSYGVRCVGANWALMLLMFAIGAASVVAMAMITALMAWESMGHRRIRVERVAGYAFIAAGVAVLVGPVVDPLWI